MKNLILFLCAGFISCVSFGQIQTPQPSPFSRIEQKVGLTDVTLEYSRPGMRGRTIFGDLVPYDQVWRTGANSNTKITFSDNVTIGGEELPMGTYGLYTVPKKGEWEVIFYKDSNNWGVPQDWDEEKIALRTTAKVQELPFPMETFTIMFDELKMDSATLNIIWDHTVVLLEFEVPTDAITMASIDRVMNGPTANDYFAAASYYHDSGKNLNKAYEYIQKAVEGNDPAFWVYRKKSLIEADLGKKEEAVKSAKLSKAAAEKAGNQDYVKMNNDSLKEWGAQ
ncbi:hypothetical protein GCM10007103_33550 [Salinimicrobium marinum]|uniref:DUF2911 domain-containing protein n=1 Tax=Salinimicrobium marinum TaxID=680283 RepID=A0A918SN37_9FLAO|nr:DUF2911 domain-containing protein [Salinimicrobium marinum]GHA50037.1 hypothetical protein GCM10007103_33550 [Salinimicrobium marinum]